MATAGIPTTRTARLDLRPPVRDDLDGLYAICTDPRVWAHFPALRHTDPAQTLAMIDRWAAGWEVDGLGTWVARLAGDDRVVGYGGCSVLGGVVWNLGYRLAADLHGQGLATELAGEAVRQAHEVAPGRPVIAYLLEHNAASAGVARKLGFDLVHRGRDAGNPDPDAVRLVYADRPLDAEQLAAAMR
ncbi:GNAT family N-acetyltransferase [Agromyces sp. MMS24-K17]|uniref:GNAT family N-acetyltransferase n=1 Tax=Agromyces sp. MMS24-K17 TaxID=3372850 RepID=UPI0037540E1F